MRVKKIYQSSDKLVCWSSKGVDANIRINSLHDIGRRGLLDESWRRYRELFKICRWGKTFGRALLISSGIFVVAGKDLYIFFKMQEDDFAIRKLIEQKSSICVQARCKESERSSRGISIKLFIFGKKFGTLLGVRVGFEKSSLTLRGTKRGRVGS